MKQSPPKINQSAEQISVMQLGILILSIYVLIALAIQTIFKLSPKTNGLLDTFDFIVCIFFLGDAIYRLFKAENKLDFLKWGWIDFVSSIPSINFLRFGRVFRIIRIIRLLRAFRSTKNLITYLFRNKAESTLGTSAAVGLLILFFCSIAILNVENDPNSNIKSAGDAMWWGLSTITTVGYGDRYPVTWEGRAVAIILMITGVGLFGTFTAYLAKSFLNPAEKNEESDLDALRKEIAYLKEKIDNLDRRIP